MPTARLALCLTASMTLTAVAAALEEPTLEQRLERLSERLEAAREATHVPGLSIGIVQDGELVFARGFGLADVAAERPADAETIYAIGSTTKAFTAALVGMLVDGEQASWDDPVTDYLPYFDLAVRSEDESAECTLRDLLCHRHGFARMTILWMGGKLSREEVLRTAAGAEPWDDFRAGFHYSNVTYLAAGEAAGVAGGSSWDELMVQRIFEPLGMSSSTLTSAEAQLDPRLALGYAWDPVSQELTPRPMVELTAIGPAGSVNSTVTDMAQWLRLQLGRGEVDGERLISTEQLLETWRPQIEIEKGVSYGLGWMLREHDGHEVVEHGGSIDGFSAQVAFMPAQNLGYVLLMNLDAAPLREASVGLVFDALLDEWPSEEVGDESEVAAVEVVFEDYVGTYVANFATFRDEVFEVLVTGDKLALDVPSQRTFELVAPNREGKWGFALTDSIAVSFRRDDQGAVIGLTMHQGGFDFEVPRQGVEITPEVPAAELEKYVGTYVRAEGGKLIEFSIVHGGLSMEDKGKRMPMRAPDAEGRAVMRASADYWATFSQDAEGRIESLVFHGSAGDKLFTRQNKTPDGELPTLDEVLALRRTDERVAAMQASGGTRITGEVWIAQAGVRGALTIHSLGGERFANHMDFGKLGRIDVVARGGEAWRYDPMRGFEALKGDDLSQALLEHPGAVEGDWREHFDQVELVRNDTLDDRPVHVVRLTSGHLPSRTYWVDAEDGAVLRVNLIAIERTIRIPVTITYSDFDRSGAFPRPRRVEIENPASGKTVLTFEQVETGLELADAVFTLEDPDVK